MLLTVRDKEFKIDFVSNYVQEKYTELTELAFDHSSADTATKEGRQKLVETTKRLVSVRKELVKEIVESNGYEYEENWWSRKTSPNDLNGFVFSCVSKDWDSGDKIKKK
jgi:hypothetical protein